jgi:iron complex transport system substrate-binding protein
MMLQERRLSWAVGALLATVLLMGQPGRAQEQAARVIALGGDITEIVYALGEGARLVGRDSTSTYPPEAKALPDAGYVRQLGAEGVLSLKPELVLASASAGPPIVLEQLKSAGVRLVQLPDAHNQDSLHRKVTVIANELGVPDKGAKLAAELDGRMNKVEAEVAAMSGRPRVLFIMNAGNGAPLASGRDTAAAALIDLAGGENVFASHSGYKPISVEAAAATNPDAIALMKQSLDEMGGIEGVAQRPALRLTRAAREGRIFGREGSYLLSFGPRLPDAILDFARAIREQGHAR